MKVMLLGMQAVLLGMQVMLLSIQVRLLSMQVTLLRMYNFGLKVRTARIFTKHNLGNLFDGPIVLSEFQCIGQPSFSFSDPFNLNRNIVFSS